MPLPLIDGFEINRSVPIDKRFVVQTAEERDAILFKYPGLSTFVVNLDEEYLWNGEGWRIKSGSGSGDIPIASATTLGIVRIGENINVTAGGTISVTAPYVHPSAHSADIITQDTTHRFVSDTQISTWNSKEAALSQGLITQYYRGDKTWQPLDTDAVAEGTNKYFTESKVKLTLLTGLTPLNSPITGDDGVMSAIAKAQGQINNREPSILSGQNTQYWRGDKSWQPITKTTVGLDNVSNLDTSTTVNITDSTDKRFITDSQKTILQNTSGTNTGDETQSTIKTKLGPASTGIDGYLTATDRAIFIAKQDALAFTPENITNKDIDGTLLANSDTKYPSQKAVKTYADSTLTAAKSYADNLVVGLWDDRGSYNASGNSYPTTGGSGAEGIVLKGDIWTISVSGILGGIQTYTGDLLRSLSDNPGQTPSNWSITSRSIGYVAENAINKDTDGTLVSNSDVKYPSQKAIKTYVDGGLSSKMASNATSDAVSEGTTNKYFTENKVRSSILTGLVTSSNTSITEADSVITAFGKLQAQTNAKVSSNTSITGATKTKITYDSNGLVTSGSDATTADIADSLDKRYITDAQQTVLSNTSNTNTGDETQNTIKSKLGITTLSGSNTGDQDLSGITSSLANKVDKITGKGLSTEDFTSDEKTLLANQSGTNTGDQDLSGYVQKSGTDRLITQTEVEKLSALIEHYKGTYTTEANLISSVPLAIAGDYAFVDVGLLGNAKLYVWDTQTGWIKEGDAALVTSVGGYTGAVVLTTADINDSSNRRYVNDSQKIIIGNTSGTNSGDETQSTIKTKLGVATASVDGYLTSTDFSTFSGKQNSLGFTPENPINKDTSGGYLGINSEGNVNIASGKKYMIGGIDILSSVISGSVLVGNFDASLNILPTVGSGTGGVIRKGDFWVISTGGTIVGLTPNSKLIPGDVLFARIDNASLATDFFSVEGNQDIADITSRLSTLEGKTELSDYTDDATHRLVTDTEKSTWNGKQNTSSESLNTTSKDIVGAINEINSKPANVTGLNGNIVTIQNNQAVDSGLSYALILASL